MQRVAMRLEVHTVSAQHRIQRCKGTVGQSALTVKDCLRAQSAANGQQEAQRSPALAAKQVFFTAFYGRHDLQHAVADGHIGAQRIQTAGRGGNVF